MTKLFNLIAFFLPLSVSAQFNEVASTLCDLNTKAFIIFGGDDDLVATIMKQPELKPLMIYRLDFTSEFGQRLKVNAPTMYLFDKNMMALAQEDVSRSGWRRMKTAFARKTAKDCLLMAENIETEPAADLVSRPSEEELGEFKIEVEDVEDWQPEPLPEAPKPAAPEKAVASLSKTATAKAPNEDLPHGLVVQKFWTVQIGAYTTEARAKSKAAQYPELYPEVKQENGFYKVTFGTFTQEASAKEFAAKYQGFAKLLTW